jgi:catechol 2,3-dioxygenase-like lactoylglutathione lyase family enzyme
LIQHVSFEVRPDQLDACIEFYAHMNAGHAAVPMGDDYEVAQARLREAGHQVDHHEEYWGSPRSFARDPAGNLVELMKFAPPPQL